MWLPGIFCALSLLLCGLYPSVMGALPSPRATAQARVQRDSTEIRRGQDLVDVTGGEACQRAEQVASEVVG